MYDAVCFKLASRRADGECAVVQVDHEDILTRERIRVVAQVAPSLLDLIS